MTTIRIKDMVCPRCIMVVTDCLNRLQLTPLRVELGIVELQDNLSAEQLRRLEQELRTYGFEVMNDDASMQVQQIKQCLLSALRNMETEQRSLSAMLATELRTDYDTLSRNFSAIEGRTIENYFISLRIERIKELLSYGELSVKEIAFRTGFSSVGHLSRQFKQVVGLTPTEFRHAGNPGRKPLCNV